MSGGFSHWSDCVGRATSIPLPELQCQDTSTQDRHEKSRKLAMQNCGQFYDLDKDFLKIRKKTPHLNYGENVLKVE